MTVHSTFNTGEPLAYFLTWTTYGTWLPGDERGWNRKVNPKSIPPNALFVENGSIAIEGAVLHPSHQSREPWWRGRFGGIVRFAAGHCMH